MPTILYQNPPLVYLRSKKTGSHSVKHCMRQYAEENSISFLEVRSKDTDTLDDHKFISHMPAKVLQKRLDVWDTSKKFTFVRNPWKCLNSYYYFNKYTGPKYNWNNLNNYSLDNIEDFTKSLIDIKGTCNFNREIYTIDDQVICDVYDVKDIDKIMKEFFNISAPKIFVQNYDQEDIVISEKIDSFIHRDYSWEIDEFGFEKPLD